jgi:hypothetical protein
MAAPAMAAVGLGAMTSFEAWLEEISKPARSLLGTGSLTARRRWENHLELARERRERTEELDMAREVGGNDED